MMDIPDLPPPDIGDLGSTPPRLAPLPLDPLPARSSSPPLPPRKNAQGLPPTYLAHLRALLHQWLEQQRTADDAPAIGSESSRNRLWNDHRLNQIEEAIWKGAVIPDPSCGKRHLLELDWTRWAPAAAKRKRIWREETHMKDTSPRIDKRDQQVKAKRTQSIHQDEASKDLLSAPPTAAASLITLTPQRSSRSASTSATPKRSADMTRTSSVASPAPASDTEDADDQKEFYDVLASLRGFHKIVNPNQDEWEVLDGESRHQIKCPLNCPQSHVRQKRATRRRPRGPGSVSTSCPLSRAFTSIVCAAHFAAKGDCKCGFLIER